MPFSVAGAQSSSPTVLDSVVAVVNNQAILQSDLNNEMRLSILEPRFNIAGPETPQSALQRLISRTLIEQQIENEDVQATIPDPAEIQQRIRELRRQSPACVQANCVTQAGWDKFLKDHDLTEAEVETYMKRRIEILRFIERRFRQGIQIPEKDIETYYHDNLVPQYTNRQDVPPLDQVSKRIQEILLQQQVSQLFSGWLENLRKQGEIEVLDPRLETAGLTPDGSVGGP
ncbi:MAG: SurA N-terminal domain-containing protein [Acidobacteriota bacterium]|nr:SurA N-terminal domain-containing protein [Acidobacteriota bacterium]